MIKSYLLNNLLVPLQQVSPQMLLASAALHGLLFTVPVPQSKDAVSSQDAANILAAETGETAEPLYNQDGSISEAPGVNSLGEGNAVTVPGEPPLLGLDDGTKVDPDLALGEPGAGASLDESAGGSSLDESGAGSSLDEPSISVNELGADGSVNESFTPSPEIPNNGTSSSNFPAENNNISPSESEPQTNFTPSQPVNESVPEFTNSAPESTITPSKPEKVTKPESTNPTTESKSEETPSQTNNTNQERPVNPFADFPNYISIKPNFCGVQSARIDRRTRITADSLNAVKVYFEKTLTGTDFQVEKLTDEADTKVYQVSKGNLTQFLQLFAVKEQGTMILLSSERVDCYRLSNQNQQEKSSTDEQAFDTTFSNLYAQLGWMEEKNFVITSDIEKVLGKDIKNTPEELALLVKNKLDSDGFKVSQIEKDAASELLYEVKKGEFIKYISFVPTQEGEGAIILALKNSPV